MKENKLFDEWFPVGLIVSMIVSGGVYLVILSIASIEGKSYYASLVAVGSMLLFFGAGYFTKTMRVQDKEEAKKSCP